MKIKSLNKNPDLFFCTGCGHQGIPIMRPKCKNREAGHLKKLYCIYCKKEVNHVEIREQDQKYTEQDFKLEYELGRFINGDRIEIKNLMKCSTSNCEYNLDGNCWNANYSYDCNHRPKRGDYNE